MGGFSDNKSKPKKQRQYENNKQKIGINDIKRVKNV